MRKIRFKWLIIYIFILCIVIPGCVKVEFIGTEAAENYRNTAQKVSDGCYLMKDAVNLGEEPMKYNFPDTLFNLIPLRNYVSAAPHYQYIIRNKSGVGTLYRTFSSIRIYYGALKLYEMKADELVGHIAGTDAFYIDDYRNLCFVIDDGGEVMFTINGIRKPVIVKIALLYLSMVVVGVILYLLDRRNHRITNAAERLQEYIIGIFKTILNRKHIIKKYCINLLTAAIIVLLVNKVFLAFDIKGLIEKEEVDCLIFAGAIVCTHLSFYAENRKMLCLAALCVIAGMSFSALYMTSYFTVDEVRAINEQVSLQSDILRHWYMQNAHTNYLLVGSFFRAIPGGILEGMSINSQQFAKVVHWFMGFMVIHLTIVFMTNRFFDTRNKKNILLILASCYLAMFLLPVFNIAMTNFNYDLFSCIFGVSAVVVIWYAYETKSLHCAGGAVVLCTLAVQEKRLAIPLLFVISVLWLDIYCTIKDEKNRKAGWLGSAYVILMQIGVWLLTDWWVLSVLLRGEASRVQKPVLNMLLLVEKQMIEPIIKGETARTAAALLILWIGLVAVRKLYDIIRKIIEKNQIERYFVKLLAVFVLLFHATGVVLTYLHVGRYTTNGSIIYMLNYIQSFVAAYPTVFLIASAVWLIWQIYTGSASWFRMFMLFFLTYIMTVLYTIIGEYGAQRYMNLYIMSYMVVQTILILLSIERLEITRVKRYAALLGLVFTLVEVFPSIKFGFTVFHPYWDISIYQNGISATGWGSLRAWYGREIEKYCKEQGIDVDTISICTAYWGTWNDNYAQIPVYYFMDIDRLNNEMLNDKVFYCAESECLISRKDFMGGFDFPVEEVEPLIYVRYRGVPVAYIYRGDQLKDVWSN